MPAAVDEGPGVERAARSWTMWPKFIWQMLNSPVIKAQFGD